MNDAAKRSQERRNFILEGNQLKVLFVVALPQIVTMLIDSVYNMTDTFFVSWLGDAAVAAVGVNDSLMMIIRAISLGFGIGCASFIARALGAKKDEEASRAAVTTIITAAATMAVLAVIGSADLSSLVGFLGASDTVMPHSMDYARWILISSPVTAVTVCLSQTLRSEGNTKHAMFGTVSGCVVNIALDPLFISVLGLGVAGAAIATGISKVISMIILLTPYVQRKCLIRLNASYFTPTKEIYKELALIGIPTIMRTGMMSIATIFTNNVAASFGDAALAAVSISNKSLRFVSSAVMGLGQGLQPITGYSWGAKKYSRVISMFKYAIIIGGVIGLTLGALLAVFAGQVIRMFSEDHSVLALGLILMRTQCAVLAPHLWVVIVNGFLQALGLPYRSGFLGLSRHLIALIPSVFILSFLFGAVGLAWAQATADVISFTLAAVLVIPVLKRIRALSGQEG